MWPTPTSLPGHTLLHFLVTPSSHSVVFLVFLHTQSVLASGPLHMLFSSTGNALPPPGAPCTVPYLSQFLLHQVLTQVLLPLGSPPRCLQVWLGPPCSIHRSQISHMHGPLSTSNKSVLHHHHSTRPMGVGVGKVVFPPTYLTWGNKLHCKEVVWNRPRHLFGQNHVILASFNPSNIFQSKNVQYLLLLLWESELEPQLLSRRHLLAPEKHPCPSPPEYLYTPLLLEAHP